MKYCEIYQNMMQRQKANGWVIAHSGKQRKLQLQVCTEADTDKKEKIRLTDSINTKPSGSKPQEKGTVENWAEV